jgi:hypothetical protein
LPEGQHAEPRISDLRGCPRGENADPWDVCRRRLNGERRHEHDEGEGDEESDGAARPSYPLRSRTCGGILRAKGEGREANFADEVVRLRGADLRLPHGTVHDLGVRSAAASRLVWGTAPGTAWGTPQILPPRSCMSFLTIRDEASPQQAIPHTFGQPACIRVVRLPPRDLFHMDGIPQDDLKVRCQQMKHRFPQKAHTSSRHVSSLVQGHAVGGFLQAAHIVAYEVVRGQAVEVSRPQVVAGLTRKIAIL